ncbi:MAG: hypothetical protein F7C37_07770 [Desulfurococcales archaeon]|nr:hypothetical protein [Desulfurococcales archaeon]
MQGGRGSLEQGMVSLLARRARSVLMSGWSDYYSRDYEWAIRKAWESASTATLQWDPAGGSPVSWRLLSSPCPAATGIAGDAAYLDGLYLVVSNQWLGLILPGEAVSASKADALDAIEEAVRVLDAVEACTPLKPKAPGSRVALELGVPHAFRLGPILVVVEDGLEDIPLAERLRARKALIPPGYYPVILTSDEALGLVSTPLASYYASLGEAEVLADETGVVELVLSGVHTG